MTRGSELEEARVRDAYERRKKSVPQDRYSWFNPGNLLNEQELERCVLLSLRKFGRATLQDKRILEVGCGSGHVLRNLIRWGAQPENVFGVDLLEDRISSAHRLLPKLVTLTVASATELDFPSQTFDLVVQYTMFSSILDDRVRQRVAGEMLRVLKAEGCILWYDFHMNNPMNPDVRGVKKPEICRLFPNCRVHFRRLTLAPPIARRLAWVSPTLCQGLAGMKVFSTHYLVCIMKDTAS